MTCGIVSRLPLCLQFSLDALEETLIGTHAPDPEGRVASWPLPTSEGVWECLFLCTGFLEDILIDCPAHFDKTSNLNIFM